MAAFYDLQLIDRMHLATNAREHSKGKSESRVPCTNKIGVD